MTKPRCKEKRQRIESIPYVTRDRGFTLVELLVVIAIVAILSSLLLPALSRAKASSQRIVCSNQMRQISLTALMYADDYHGKMPDRAQDERWDLRLGIGNQLPLKLLKCPNDRSSIPSHNTQSQTPSIGNPAKSGREGKQSKSPVRIGSYLMNGFSDVGLDDLGNLDMARNTEGTSLSAVLMPVKTILFGEKSSESANFYADVFPLTSDYLLDVEERRHSGSAIQATTEDDWTARSNYSFVDGHVEAIPFGKSTCPENMWCVSEKWRLNAALCRPRY